MSFLQRFRKNDARPERGAGRPNGFGDLSEEQLEAHLSIARYGRFTLTEAVRPSYDLEVVPREGFRRETFKDKESGVSVPVLMAAATKEHLFDLFLELLTPLGDEVDVVLEMSHDRESGHDDAYREHIDMPVLKSTLCDFEELLTDDGCLGVAVLNPSIPLEVQFDEHKLLVMYGKDLEPFQEILERYGIYDADDVKFITEAEHIHSSSDEFGDGVRELRYRLGIDD